ncbi:GreA/GreB family elongation factor [Amycolatopsis samaneae]|uniref:GreA/GreB family elongation factor n=1 Tax=Amycolatopsis samaneae TaxID=664691 RepID=A0ABW5GI86_9PSEU
MPAKFLFMPRDIERLEAEMARHERRYKANLGDIGEAVDVSSETWHDNPAFDEAQQQARAAYAKLKELQAIRDQATIVTERPAGDRAEIGCRVRYARSDLRDDDEVVIGSYFLIDGDEDEVSAQSPLGQLLLGAKVGDSISGTIGERRVTITVKDIAVAEEYFPEPLVEQGTDESSAGV